MIVASGDEMFEEMDLIVSNGLVFVIVVSGFEMFDEMVLLVSKGLVFDMILEVFEEMIWETSCNKDSCEDAILVMTGMVEWSAVVRSFVKFFNIFVMIDDVEGEESG